MSRFSKDETAQIVGAYVADAVGGDYESRTAVVKTIAVAYDVTENVIRGVLVAEDVYVKKEAVASTASKRVDKEAISLAVEAFLGIKVKSVRNMTGKDLTAMWERLVVLSDVRNAAEGKV